MGTLRRIAVGLGVLGGVAAAAGATALADGAAGPPTIGAPTVVTVTPTTAELQAPLDTGDQATRVGFAAGPGPGYDPDTASALVTVPASPTPVTVTGELGDLVPNTAYVVKAGAVNASGRTAGPAGTFTTLLLPAPQVRFDAATQLITLGHRVVLAGVTAGAPAGAAVVPQFLAPSGATFRSLPDQATTVADDGGFRILLAPDRNTRYRLLLPGTGGFNVDAQLTQRPTATASRLIYVLPTATVASTRPFGDGRIRLVVRVHVHPVARNYVSSLAVFYTGRSRRGPLTEVGVARLRAIAPTVLAASVLIENPHRFFFGACLRSPAVPDMGPAFHNARCGRPVLR